MQRNDAGGSGRISSQDQHRLRPATNRDAAEIWNVISAILSSFGIVADQKTTDRDLTDIEDHYWDRGGVFFVLLDGQTVIGTVALRRESDRVCELCRMYLAADHRGLGLGRRLFDHAMAEARNRGFREIYLKTASVLTTAIALYESAGFRPVSDSKAEGNCDRVMRMELPAQSIFTRVE
jgi:putative acetyltransferase